MGAAYFFSKKGEVKRAPAQKNYKRDIKKRVACLISELRIGDCDHQRNDNLKIIHLFNLGMILNCPHKSVQFWASKDVLHVIFVFESVGNTVSTQC